MEFKTEKEAIGWIIENFPNEPLSIIKSRYDEWSAECYEQLFTGLDDRASAILALADGLHKIMKRSAELKLTELDHVIHLRTMYRTYLTQAEDTDSKSEEKEFKRKADIALVKLRSNCTHFYTIILNSAYEGSRSWDYDDYKNENRLCLCCGLRESASSRQEFKTLKLAFKRFEENWKFAAPLEHELRVLVVHAEKSGYEVR